MKINLNDRVRVRLTDRGRLLYKRNHVLLNVQHHYTLREVDGWSEWTLWDLMQNFGKYIYVGAYGDALPFEPTIEVLEGCECT